MADQKFFENAAGTRTVSLNLDNLSGDHTLTIADTTGTIATQAYVDALFNAGSRKQSVKAATTANITLSGNQTVDGVALVDNDRVLVKNQTTTSENGLYLVASGAWTRTVDFDADADVTGGAVVLIEQGTTQADQNWAMTTDDPVVGTDAIAFQQTSGSAAPVSSVFGRTGAVVATAGDYTAANITNVAAGNIVATNVQDALNELDTEKADSTALAATTASNGASLIGIQDAGTFFTGTTVEAAMQEVGAAIQTSTATTEGIIELATSAEVAAGDATRAVTGATLLANVYSEGELNATTATSGASLIGVNDSGGLFTATTVETVLAEVGGEVDDILTVIGVSAGATSLGTFTGTIITDNVSAKTALQELETYVEANSLTGAAPDWTVSNNTVNRTFDPTNATMQDGLFAIATAIEDLITRGVLQ